MDSMATGTSVMPYSGRLTIVLQVIVDDRDSDAAGRSPDSDMVKAIRGAAAHRTRRDVSARLAPIHDKRSSLDGCWFNQLSSEYDFERLNTRL